MRTLALTLEDLAAIDPDRLVRMAPAEFVREWQRLVGEPPAALLDDRSAMIRILLSSVAGADTVQAGPTST